MQAHFEGIWVPIVTPLSNDGVDHSSLTRLAQYLARQGIAGLVAGATTGEGALLRAGEQEAIFTTLRAAVPELPIVLGISQPSTEVAASLARSLSMLQPDGLLVAPPIYVRPSQQGIQRHFEAVAEVADLPILIYNIPYRTGVNVEIATLQSLARDPRIAGIKECGGTPERMLRLVHETPLKVFSGDDSQNFVALCLGAHGVIAASAHVLPSWHVHILERLRQGDLDAARRTAVALQPIIRCLFEEPNPAPLKALLAAQGYCEATVRLPFVPVSQDLRERLRSEWDTLRQLESLPV